MCQVLGEKELFGAWRPSILMGKIWSVCCGGPLRMDRSFGHFGGGCAVPFKNLCPADMAHIRQKRPCSGFGFQVRVREMFQVVPPLLGGGLWFACWDALCFDGGSYRIRLMHAASALPLSREYGRYKTVKDRLWPWLSITIPSTLTSYSVFARERTDLRPAFHPTLIRTS